MKIKTALGVGVLTGMLAVTSPADAANHEVKKGETMSGIASEYGIPLTTLAKMNPHISNINLIFPGQEIDVEGKARSSYTPPAAAKKVESVTTSATSSDADLLARLVEAEAGDESYAGKVAVANVVLNRVHSSQFPNTIKGVIYQPGQFSPVSNGMINRKAQADSIKAAEEALANPSNDGSLFFWNPGTASSRWLESRPTTKVIGNHEFKK